MNMSADVSIDVSISTNLPVAALNASDGNPDVLLTLNIAFVISTFPTLSNLIAPLANCPSPDPLKNVESLFNEIFPAFAFDIVIFVLKIF